jgi:hypothetical protein
MLIQRGKKGVPPQILSERAEARAGAVQYGSLGHGELLSVQGGQLHRVSFDVGYSLGGVRSAALYIMPENPLRCAKSWQLVSVQAGSTILEGELNILADASGLVSFAHGGGSSR